MRSFAEIKFRVRQEAMNIYLWLIKPKFQGNVERKLALPNTDDIVKLLRGSSYVNEIEQLAKQVNAHRIPILGLSVDTGAEIRWRFDYVNNIESAPSYFRRIPYLEFSAVGDHKVVWELSRHQHLVLLAQAFLFTGNRSFLTEIFNQLESWLQQNPFQCGINWASALEVAFRTLSWIWLYHLISQEMPAPLRKNFLNSLYQHGRHLAENLSVYFSPNTHLLGEAVALYALALLFPEFPNAASWREVSKSIVAEQLTFQVREDGSHFEQSSYYHVYALDFFVFFYILSGQPSAFRPKLEQMAEYLYSLLGPNRQISFWGDDDGGRLFHPYGNHHQFGRATLATCGILFGRQEWVGTQEDLAKQAVWWLGTKVFDRSTAIPKGSTTSRVYKDSGLIFLVCDDFYLQMDCGHLGYGGAGHSHSDTLSFVLHHAGQPVLIDPGTYLYMGNIDERNWFRGTVSHNTVLIDGQDQGTATGPFRWQSKPQISLNKCLIFNNGTEGGYVDAICHYKGFQHRRRILLRNSQLLTLDEIDGPVGNHVCEQHWLLGQASCNVQFAFSAPVTEAESQFSPAYRAKLPTRSLIAKQSGTFPMQIAMLLTVDERLNITVEEAQRTLTALIDV